MRNVLLRDGIPSYDELISMFLKGELSDVFDLVRRQVEPGNHVVLKPNFVKESHLERRDEWLQIVTNGAIIRCVLISVVEALDEEGLISIVDAPQTDSDYEAIIKRVGLSDIVREVQATTRIPIKFYDLREERWFFRQGIVVSKKKLAGDPMGYTNINLGDSSFFDSKPSKEYYGADYDRDETKRFHNELDNIYVISNTILDADVFINLPKLKTHKLGGMTCCLKNLVGTCVIKNSLPHHTVGTPESGGDQFPNESKRSSTEGKLKLMAAKVLRHKNPIINYPFILFKKIAGVAFGSPETETVRNGSWYGNDTIWRTTLDLNRILLYADKAGVMKDEVQRKYVAIVDAIVAGDGNGPMSADAKACGALIAGDNPVSVDFACARLMGFDWRRIPTVAHGFDPVRWPLANFAPNEVVLSDIGRQWHGTVLSIDAVNTWHFKPHFGWKGHIELVDL